VMKTRANVKAVVCQPITRFRTLGDEDEGSLHQYIENKNKTHRVKKHPALFTPGCKNPIYSAPAKPSFFKSNAVSAPHVLPLPTLAS